MQSWTNVSKTITCRIRRADPQLWPPKEEGNPPGGSGSGEGLYGPHEVFGAIPVIAVSAEARRGGGEQYDAVAAGPVERGTGGLVQVVALADVEVRGPLAGGVGDARPTLGHAQDQQVRPPVQTLGERCVVDAAVVSSDQQGDPAAGEGV